MPIFYLKNRPRYSRERAFQSFVKLGVAVPKGIFKATAPGLSSSRWWSCSRRFATRLNNTSSKIEVFAAAEDRPESNTLFYFLFFEGSQLHTAENSCINYRQCVYRKTKLAQCDNMVLTLNMNVPVISRSMV